MDINTSRIHIARGEAARLGALLRRCKGLSRRALLLTDRTVSRLHAAPLIASLRKAGFHPLLVTLPQGEGIKRFSVVASLCRRMAAAGIDRYSPFIALGGGTICDLGGFVASIYMRGIPFFSVPTTLLAQIDAAIGGKNGINLPEGKNLVGTFCRPRLAIVDPGFIETLPRKRLLEGVAEELKAGVVADETLFRFIAGNVRRILHRDPSTIRRLIARSIAVKSAIVRQDERDTNNRRAILNFGHTIGHALELTGGIAHGRAVAVGMAVESTIAVEKVGFPPLQADLLRETLRKFALPISLPQGRRQSILRRIAVDKKNRDGVLRFALPTRIGKALFPVAVSADVVARLIGEHHDNRR